MAIEHQSLEDRLTSLKAEHDKGVQQLAGLRQKQEDVRHTLLRIQGAIQVLEELLTPHEPAAEQKPMAAVQ